MITFCKNCGAALDETMATCRDCGMPNPYGEQDPETVLPQYARFGLVRTLIGFARNNSHLERTLLTLGAIDLPFAMIWLMGISATPWAQIPPSSPPLAVGSFVLGIGNVVLAIQADLERPVWRAVARGAVALNLVGLTLLVWLDRVGLL
jgi:hypothetical protein